jgi:hypothetical protein
VLQTNDHLSYAVLVVDVATGEVRALARLDPCNGPQLSWSPDGRLVALTSLGNQDCQDIFEVIDAASAGATVLRLPPQVAELGGTAWAPNSRSLFGAVFVLSADTSKGSSRIDRFYLNGRRTPAVESSAGWLVPDVALPTGLVCHAQLPPGRGGLYLRHFATGCRDLLMSARSSLGFQAVLPLPQVP